MGMYRAQEFQSLGKQQSMAVLRVHFHVQVNVQVQVQVQDQVQDQVHVLG